MAGRKGKCVCGAVVDIPVMQTIRFRCPMCGQKLEMGREYAGWEGRCPACQAGFRIPGKSETRQSAGQQDYQFKCTACGAALKQPEEMCGRIIECPQCGEYTMVPIPGGDSPRRARRDPDLSVISGQVVCPSCGDLLGDNSRVCVGCGIYVDSGRPVLTARGMDEQDLYDRVRMILSLPSWLMWFGWLPVYSEARGRHRPISVWLIAAVTIVISVIYLNFNIDQSPKMRTLKNLMLWTGKQPPSAEQIEQMYEYTSYGDTKAYETMKEQLKGSMPKKDLPLAAMERLSPEQQCIGQFHSYQFVTHAFLHGGVMHLAGNLLFLLIFGSRVCTVLGNIRTPILYLLLAIGAGWMHWVMSTDQPPVPMLGASGAVMGMAGVYLVLFPMQRVYMTVWFRFLIKLFLKVFAVPGFCVVLFYIMFDVVKVSLDWNDHVAHWAHIGGFVWGVTAGIGLLAARQVYSGGDILSLIFGKFAWPLIGKPHGRV